MMLVGSSVRISSVGCESADIDGSCIPFQTTVTYLGVHLDQTLSMKQHISSLCRTTFLALRRIASIRPFLSNSSTEKLVASMITSRLDYCNATFAGVADEQIARIEKIQNNAARLILKKSLGSSTERLLTFQKTNLKTFGGRSFGYIAPTVWNSLPADLRASPSLPTLKVNLKTHFFRQAF